MSLRQIVPEEWRPFLENLGRERHAWLATLELDGVTEAHDEPLAGIAADDRVEIRVGRKAIRVEPRCVQVEEIGGGTQLLDIEDVRGRHVTLRFRVAAAPGALDGLAPAERH